MQCPIREDNRIMSSLNSVRIESPEEFRARVANKTAIKIDICLPGSGNNGGE
jgi:N-glycosylase/DNA lyase